MRKTFKMYAVCWAVLLIAFNAICFIIPNEIAGISKFDGAFWVGYAFITLAFIGQIICSYFAFKADNLRKLFYNIPVITASYWGLILTSIFGIVCMAVKIIPDWLGAIPCLLVLVFNVISVIKASAVSDIVENVDKKVSMQTQFIKLTTAKAESIMNSATNATMKSDCRKVYEAVRYSDPMSNSLLFDYEAKIAENMQMLENLVKSENVEAVHKVSEELILIINDRNRKCKVLK